LLAAKASHPSLASAFEAIGQAEAIVAATPTYKAAYAGFLKAFLDLAPPNALAGKKVLPFMLGATPLHALALDFSFKPLFMAMGAGRLASGAFFLDERFTKQVGQYVLTPELAEQVSKMLVDFIEV
jgi:FMN reductase